jgi:hypothetical protein
VPRIAWTSLALPSRAAAETEARPARRIEVRRSDARAPAARGDDLVPDPRRRAAALLARR